MKRWLSAAQDVVGVIGFALLERGMWLVSRPAAYVMAGALLLAVSWFWPKR
jgi:hypothetical protein